MSRNDNFAHDRTARMRHFILHMILFAFCITLSICEPVLFAAERAAGTAQLTPDETNRLTAVCVQIGGSLDLTVTLTGVGGPPLTSRELDVLRLLSHGHTNKVIAEMLSVSPRTINFHLDNIYTKLDVNSRTEAVIVALRRGWILVE